MRIISLFTEKDFMLVAAKDSLFHKAYRTKRGKTAQKSHVYVARKSQTELIYIQ